MIQLYNTLMYYIIKLFIKYILDYYNIIIVKVIFSNEMSLS